MELHHDLVSIIMPAFNAGETIAYAIKSVLDQTYPCFELIVIDDGSTDSTILKVNSFADNRIRLLSQPNQGVSVARNYGISRSSGEFIAFLDADDAWYRDKLQIQISILRQRQDLDLVFSSFEVFSAQGVSNSPVYMECFNSTGLYSTRVLVVDFIPTLTVLLRKSLLKESNSECFDPLLHGTEDWDLWIRLLQKANVFFVPQKLAYYRTSLIGLSGNFLRHHDEELKVLQKHQACFRSLPRYVEASAFIFWRLKAARYWLSLLDIRRFFGELKCIFSSYSFNLVVIALLRLFCPSLFLHFARRFFFAVLCCLGLVPKFKKFPFLEAV